MSPVDDGSPQGVMSLWKTSFSVYCRKFTIYLRKFYHLSHSVTVSYISNKLLSVPLCPLPPAPHKILLSIFLTSARCRLVGVVNAELVLRRSFLKLLTKERHLIHYVNQTPPQHTLISRVPAGIAGNQLEFHTSEAFYVYMLISSCWFYFMETSAEG